MRKLLRLNLSKNLNLQNRNVEENINLSIASKISREIVLFAAYISVMEAV